MLTLLVFTSCYGQVKTDLPKDNLRQETASAENHPMMIRTQGVQSGNVSCELLDIDGNLWFSIGGEGVYRYNGASFTNFTAEDGLCTNDVGHIIQRKSGDILISTNKGICMYDGKTFSNFLVADSINKLAITSLLEDRDENIWFGTMNSGIYRYDGKNLSNFLNNNDHPFNLGNHHQLIMDKTGWSIILFLVC